MAHIFALSGPGISSEKKAQLDGDGCKIITNGRTKRKVRLCYVGKSARYRSGWLFKPLK